MRFWVVIEEGENNYSAYIPELPGCVAAADTLEETKELIAEAAASHIELMVEDGLPIAGLGMHILDVSPTQVSPTETQPLPGTAYEGRFVTV